MIETVGLAFLLGVVVTVAALYVAANTQRLGFYGLIGFHYGRSFVDVVLPRGRHARRWWQ